MTRTIELIGNDCVFIKIASENKPLGLLFFHVLFSTEGKPSSEIAINPQNGSILYIKYYIFKEELIPTDYHPLFPACEMKIKYPKETNEKNYISQLNGFFIPMICSSCIVVINSSCNISKCSCYSVDQNNGLLFQDDCFAGIKVDGITDSEKQVLLSSECL